MAKVADSAFITYFLLAKIQFVVSFKPLFHLTLYRLNLADQFRLILTWVVEIDTYFLHVTTYRCSTVGDTCTFFVQVLAEICS